MNPCPKPSQWVMHCQHRKYEEVTFLEALSSTVHWPAALQGYAEAVLRVMPIPSRMQVASSVSALHI